jgi:hypothetical protein
MATEAGVRVGEANGAVAVVVVEVEVQEAGNLVVALGVVVCLAFLFIHLFILRVNTTYPITTGK